ncbi:MAG TPA: hypothetical protein ENG35_02580 [Desulfobacteraceae bacterium]|nr:hypothetical protein [Desulfobacteraceae bacterium]
MKTELTPLSIFLSYFKSLLENRELASSFANHAGISIAKIDSYLSANPRRSYTEGVKFMKD